MAMMQIIAVRSLVPTATFAQIDSSAGGYAGYYGLVIAVVGSALLAWLGYYAWHNKDDFRITVRKGSVKIHGQLPPRYRANISQFLLQDVAQNHTLRIIGNKKAGGVLRITVQGNISPGDVQRIRNFLQMTLKG